MNVVSKEAREEVGYTDFLSSISIDKFYYEREVSLKTTGYQ